MKSNSTSQGVKPFQFKTVKQAYEEPQESVTYCVDSLLKMSSLSVIAAKPKAGKSTFARQLAVAVAQGKDFLGRMTQQGTVLYFGLEEMQSEVVQHFQDMGLRDTDPVHLLCGAVRKPQAVAMLEETLKATENVRLIILDPIFRFVNIKDSNDYAQSNDALEPLLELARNYGPHILMVHHMGKREPEFAMDAILGSTAILAGVDTAIALRKDAKETRSIQTVQRYGKAMEPTQLGWCAETRQFSLGVTMDEADAVAAAGRRQQIESDIITYVLKHPGATQEAMLNAVPGRVTVKKQVMQRLIDSGVLVPTGAGVKGDPFRYTLHADGALSAQQLAYVNRSVVALDCESTTTHSASL